MHARLIANPKSGADRAPEYLPWVNEQLRTLVDDLDITLTTTALDAERAAARACADGCDAIYVAGGDGTLNAVLRGLPAGDGAPRIPIGVVPFGTGNDFAKALGLSDDIETAVAGLLDPHVLDVDVGLLNDRPFINTSAGGFIADVSESVSEELKDVTGRLAYVIGGARVLFGSEPFSARVLPQDGAPAPASGLDVRMFAICNARFIGGGHPIAPAALIDDGLLDVLIVPRMSVLDFVSVLQDIAAGDSAGRDDVVRFRSSAFDLVLSRTVRANTDGEVFETDRCRYRVRRGGATFFCGRDPHALAAPRPFLPRAA